MHYPTIAQNVYATTVVKVVMVEVHVACMKITNEWMEDAEFIK